MSTLLFIILIVAGAAMDRCPAAGVVCLEALAVLCRLGKREGLREGGTGMKYRICPHCGANLDLGERCDCQDEVATSQRETGTRGTDQTDQDKYNHIDHNE